MKSQSMLLHIIVAAVAPLMLLPMRSGAEELAAYNGAQLYQRFCAGCHGAHGLGDGPVAPSLQVMVPDLAHMARRHGGQFPTDLVRRIVDGRTVHVPQALRDMPAWGNEFRSAGAGDAAGGATADELVNRLVEYLRSIQAK